MAALHSIAGHALLSRAAAALGAAALAAHTEIAERVLGVESDYDGTPYEDAVHAALATQVSYQVEQNFVASSSGRGARSEAARSNSAGLAPPKHPLAKLTIDRIVGADGWADLTSRRG